MAELTINDGLLSNSEFRASPNFNKRPPGTDIDCLVIHCISLPAGEFGLPWIDALFLNRLKCDEHPDFADLKGLTVSSHLLIRRKGEIIQYVPFHLRAWHAGVSCFRERENCNDYSIGIELEGADDICYEPEQYHSLISVTAALMQTYPGITQDRVVGHCDIAAGRKTDPGPAFDWSYYRNKIL